MSTPEEMSVNINDPVCHVRELRRFEFVLNTPPLVAGRAVVLVASSGATRCYSAEQLPTRGELVVKSFRKLYEVDTGVHHLSFERELPSDGDAFFFHAAADVEWRVTDPAVVVSRGVRDVRALVEPRLVGVMRNETRRFSIEESAAAERAIHDALGSASLTLAEGLEVRCNVRIGLDTEAIQQYATLRSIEYAKAQQASRHELTRIETLHGHELTEAKARFYAGLLDGGDLDRWALQVAFNKDDLPLALEGIRQDQREAAQNRLRLIERMMASGAFEEHMMEEPTRLALDSLRDSLADSAQGRTRRQPLYREELDAAREPDIRSGNEEVTDDGDRDDR